MLLTCSSPPRPIPGGDFSLLTSVRTLEREQHAIGVLALDDPRAGIGQGPMPADEREAGGVDLTEVDDHHGVLVEIHLTFHRGSCMDELASAQIAYEDGVLQAFSVFFHALADLSQTPGVTDVVGDQETSSGHVVTAW
jgi:hypothetical protein